MISQSRGYDIHQSNRLIVLRGFHLINMLGLRSLALISHCVFHEILSSSHNHLIIDDKKYS